MRIIPKIVILVLMLSLVPLMRPLPTVLSAQSRLTKALSDFELTKSHNDHNLDVVVQELADLEKQEKELRIEVEKVEGKREYMEEFRRWVEMLGSFLEEKVRTLLCLVTGKI